MILILLHWLLTRKKSIFQSDNDAYRKQKVEIFRNNKLLNVVNPYITELEIILILSSAGRLTLFLKKKRNKNLSKNLCSA